MLSGAFAEHEVWNTKDKKGRKQVFYFDGYSCFS